MSFIMGIDPGEHTGYVVLGEATGDLVASGTVDLWRHLDALIEHYQPQALVVENFKLYPGQARIQIGSAFETVRVIGVVLYLAEKAGISVVLQMASEAKMLKAPSNLGKHEQDAWRHAELYRRRLAKEVARAAPSVA